MFGTVGSIALVALAISLLGQGCSFPAIGTPSSQDPLLRQKCSLEVRVKAARVAFNRKTTKHPVNGDEDRYPETKLASFTKGLPHNPRTGTIIDPGHFDLLIRAAESGLPRDLAKVPLGPPPGVNFTSSIAKNLQGKLRGFQGCGDGVLFDLEGADAQLFSINPPPKLDSKELAIEMTEVYGMSLLRDASFQDIENPGTDAGKKALEIVRWLNQIGSKRGRFTVKKFVRGTLRGDDVGPYMSQFLYAGTKGLDGKRPITDGIIQYGSSTINQRVRIATPNKDYMTTWAAYIDVQNAAAAGGLETYVNSEGKQTRFISNPRDLVTFVHYDLPFQSFLNAALIMLQNKIPFDKGIPFQAPDRIDKGRGSARWSSVHVLTLLAETTTRTFKASRYHKFNVHRRARPEELGGYLDHYLNTNDSTVAGIAPLARQLSSELLEDIADHNAMQNTNPEFDRQNDDTNGHNKSFLMPVAFPEGSPVHPSIPAGHAVVCGASATILKAYFDHTKTLDFAFKPSSDGQMLIPVPSLKSKLTIEGELNKAVSNIAIGRNWAGIHYFTDYSEGIRLGEKIAISILEEQAYTYVEDFSMTIPTFDNEIVIIRKRGAKVTVSRG